MAERVQEVFGGSSPVSGVMVKHLGHSQEKSVPTLLWREGERKGQKGRQTESKIEGQKEHERERRKRDREMDRKTYVSTMCM